MKTALLVAAALTVATASHAFKPDDPRIAPIRDWVKAGLIDSFGIERPIATIRVTAKFSALTLERQTDIAGRTCSILSVLSQEPRGDGGAVDPDDAIGICDVSRPGAGKLGEAGFNDDGTAIVRWEPWYVREMVRAKK